ncbi:hypothetical protein GCM10028807_44790 [Spirosoma daeguense]
MAQPASSNRSKSLATVIRAGLIAGILDAIAAMVMLMVRGGKDPSAVWLYVASGVFGQDAFTSGASMVIWGLAFHFIIALAFAGFFFLIFPLIHQYISQPAVIGLLYGILIWLIMNRIVLPLSNVSPASQVDPIRVGIGMVIIMVCVGLPIALIVNRHYVAR